MSRKEKVKKIIDGDTFLTNSRKNPVRLENVDTPEKGETGGSRPGRCRGKSGARGAAGLTGGHSRGILPWHRRSRRRPDLWKMNRMRRMFK